MMLEVSAVTSLLVGLLTTLFRILRQEPRLQNFWDRIEGNKALVEILKALGLQLPKKRESYEERMQRLFSKFQEVSTESQEIISEIEQNVRNKEEVVNRLDAQYIDLDKKLTDLKNRPEYGSAQTLESLERLTQEQRRDSRQGAIRDFLLFFLGVAVPFLLNWIFGQLSGAKGTP